ncbi:PREDICTED: uncharacterized protein LOC105121649 isoform X2 [Populus euphratica]|uniref:Uncharacterized protein LOC105121649 isoform X2 n=1 Tax=Populus euphratica TaxID=75702 RepID=A0AAJ6XHF7_POPEU|nr:PREDICTED: uncharacterized protein LOC105121649 isoform X2 [Populus euphratica]
MAGNLGKEEPSSVQDLQDPSISTHAYTFKHAGSGHKRRRGSVQPSSSRAGKKSKRDIDRDHREKKKEEVEKLKAKAEELVKSNIHLEGQAFQLRMDLKETREENINLKIVQKSQSDSILELGKTMLERDRVLNALKEEHAQEMLERDRELNALKEEHERQMWFIEMVIINNPMETPATAQAITNFFNFDYAFQINGLTRQDM